MGIPSGGSFGGSSGVNSSGFSSGGRFDDNSSSHHHHHSNSYDDPFYYNNQSRLYRGSSGRSGSSDGCTTPCSVSASFLGFFGSAWMIFGLFQLDQPLMSLNYSRVLTANSLFVKAIQIQNLRDPGPVVYSFSDKPALCEFVNYNETHDDFVESSSHREWRFWLNKGSKIELSYDVKGFSQDYLVLAFIRGTQGLEDWTSAPNTPSKALKWYQIHGTGIKDFVTDRDDDYFVAFGNLNSRDMEVTTEFNIRSTLYSVKGADARIALTSDIDSVNMPLSLFHTNSVLLTTPSEPQEGADVWEVAVVYSTRWTTYIAIWGTIVAVILVILGIETGVVRVWRISREELPLLAPQDRQAVPIDATSNSSSVAISSLSGEWGEHGESPLDDKKLCTVCLDAPKDCFFDPCGHRCTCYACGQRIQEGNSGLCPICRQPIRAVRRIFDA